MSQKLKYSADGWLSGRKQQTVNLPVNSRVGSNPTPPSFYMRFSSALTDWFIVLLSIILVIFFFFDEEPFLDPTDWNIVHVILFLFSILIVIWENIVKSKFGQYVFKDLVLLNATFSFWFGLETYARLVVIVFCFHCLTPLELELIELVEVHQTLVVWYTFQVMPSLLIISACYLFILQINYALNYVSVRFLLHVSIILFLLLVLNFLLMLWDFCLNGISSFNFVENQQNLYYNGSRCTISYNGIQNAEDLFDWHMSNTDVFSFRFEELYLFFLQLFNLVAAYTAVFIFLFFVIDVLSFYNTTSLAVTTLPSFTFFSTCITWFNHIFFSFFYSHFAVLLVSLRVFFKLGLNFLF